jgi:hypothetical protein
VLANQKNLQSQARQQLTAKQMTANAEPGSASEYFMIGNGSKDSIDLQSLQRKAKLAEIQVTSLVPQDGALIASVLIPVGIMEDSSATNYAVSIHIEPGNQVVYAKLPAAYSRNASLAMSILIQGLENGRQYSIQAIIGDMLFFGDNVETKTEPTGPEKIALLSTVKRSANSFSGIPGCVSDSHMQCCSRGVCALDNAERKVQCHCSAGYSGSNCELATGNTTLASTCPPNNALALKLQQMVVAKSSIMEVAIQELDQHLSSSKESADVSTPSVGELRGVSSGSEIQCQSTNCAHSIVVSVGMSRVGTWAASRSQARTQGSQSSQSRDYEAVLEAALLSDLHASIAPIVNTDHLSMKVTAAPNGFMFRIQDDQRRLTIRRDSAATSPIHMVESRSTDILSAKVDIAGDGSAVRNAIHALIAQSRDPDSSLRRGLVSFSLQPIAEEDVVALDDSASKAAGMETELHGSVLAPSPIWAQYMPYHSEQHKYLLLLVVMIIVGSYAYWSRHRKHQLRYWQSPLRPIQTQRDRSR